MRPVIVPPTLKEFVAQLIATSMTFPPGTFPLPMLTEHVWFVGG